MKKNTALTTDAAISEDTAAADNKTCLPANDNIVSPLATSRHAGAANDNEPSSLDPLGDSTSTSSGKPIMTKQNALKAKTTSETPTPQVANDNVAVENCVAAGEHRPERDESDADAKAATTTIDGLLEPPRTEAAVYPTLVVTKLPEEPVSKEEKGVATRARLLRRRDETKPPKGKAASKRGAIYARRSAEGHHPTSIERQVELGREYAARNGIEIVAVFSDEGRTGATMANRTGLHEMMARLAAGEFTEVIVEMLDRLSRDQADLHWIAKRLKRRKVIIHESIGGVVDGTNLTFKGLLSQTVREQLLFRTSKGRDLAVALGRAPHRVPFGFMRDPHRPGVRLIHPERGPEVARMYSDLVHLGLNPAAIASGLTAREIPSPGDCTHIDHGRAPKLTPWTTNNVRETMRSPRNMGLLIDRLTETVRDPDTFEVVETRLRPEDEWTIVEVPEWRIVSQELWQAAQDRLNANYHGRRARPSKNHYLLKGRVSCHCGEPANIANRNGKPTFVCSAGRALCPGFGLLRVDWIERATLAALRDHVLSDDFIDTFREAYSTRIAAATAEWERHRDRLNQEAARLSALLDRSFEEGLLDGFSYERAAAYRAGIEKNLHAVEVELRSLRKPREFEETRLRTMREGMNEAIAHVPLRGTNAETANLVAAILPLIAGLTVRPPTGSSREVELRIDLGALGDSTCEHLVYELDESVDDELAADRAAGAAFRETERNAAYLAGGGDLPDAAWDRVAKAAELADVSVSALGWSTRSLVDAIRYRSLAARHARLPARFGPAASFLAASKALVRSGAFAAIAAALADTSYAIKRSAAFAPSVLRLTPAAAAKRAELAPRSDDDDETRTLLAVAAMRADGLSRRLCANRFHLKRDAVDDIFLTYQGQGAEGLRASGCKDASRTEALDRSPLREVRLIAVRMLAKGRSVTDACAATGLSKDSVWHWRRAFERGGEPALRSASWDLTEQGFIPGPVAAAAARKLADFAAEADGFVRCRLQAVALFLNGRPRSEVLAAGVLLQEFKAAVYAYRAHGVEGLRPGAMLAGRALRDEAKSVDGIVHDRLLIVAGFLEGRKIDALAAETNRPLHFAMSTINHWVKKETVCKSRAEAVATLSDDELEMLREIIADGRDPDNPEEPVNTAVLVRICREKFALAMTHTMVAAMMAWRGFRPKPIVRAASIKACRAAKIAGTYRDATHGG